MILRSKTFFINWLKPILFINFICLTEITTTSHHNSHHFQNIHNNPQVHNHKIINFELPENIAPASSSVRPPFSENVHHHYNTHKESNHNSQRLPVKRQIQNNPNYQYYSFEFPNTNTTTFQLPPVEDHFIRYNPSQPRDQHPQQFQTAVQSSVTPQQQQPVHNQQPSPQYHHQPSYNLPETQAPPSQYHQVQQAISATHKQSLTQDQFNSIRRYPQYQQIQSQSQPQNNEPLISVLSSSNQFHPSHSVSWNPPPTHFPPSSSSSNGEIVSSAATPTPVRNAPQNPLQVSPQSIPVSNQFNTVTTLDPATSGSVQRITNSRNQPQSREIQARSPAQSQYPFQYEDLQANKSRINFHPGDHNFLAPIVDQQQPSTTDQSQARQTPAPTVISTLAPTTINTTNGKDKKDDVVIYYYYYYDDDKNTKNDPNNGLDAIPSLEGFDGTPAPTSSLSQPSSGGLPKAKPGKVIIKNPGDSPVIPITKEDPQSINEPRTDEITKVPPYQPSSKAQIQSQAQSHQLPAGPPQSQLQQTHQVSSSQITNHSLVSNIFRYGNQNQNQQLLSQQPPNQADLSRQQLGSYPTITVSPGGSSTSKNEQTPASHQQSLAQLEPGKNLQSQTPSQSMPQDYPQLEKISEYDQSRTTTTQQQTPRLTQMVSSTTARPSTSQRTFTTSTITTTTPTSSTEASSTTTEQPRRRFGNRRPGFGSLNRSTQPLYRSRLTTTTTTTTTPAPARTFTRAPPVSYNNPASVNIRRNRPTVTNRFRRPQRPGFGSFVNDERQQTDDNAGNNDSNNQPVSSSTTTTTTTPVPTRSQDQPRRFGNRGRYGGRGSYQPQPTRARPEISSTEATTASVTQSTTRRPNVYASRTRPQLRGRLPFLRNRNRNQPTSEEQPSSTSETPAAAPIADDQSFVQGSSQPADQDSAALLDAATPESEVSSEASPVASESPSQVSSSTEKPRGRQRPALFGNRPRPNLFGRRAPTTNRA